jgi:tetratricopeptide (TPR) repeat protein
VTEETNQRKAAAALLQTALAGGPDAALAAKRAALLAERNDPRLARQALAVVSKLEPLDPTPRLAAARLAAEQGDIAAALSEAEAVLGGAVDQAARARAAFMLGEIARMRSDWAAARSYFETTLKIEDALLAADRSNVTAARWFARARGRLAELDAGEGKFDRARAGAEGALALLRACAAQIKETPMLAADIADAELRLGALDLDNDQAASARRRCGEAIGRYEALAITESEEPHWRAVLADAWAIAAEADYARGAHDEARAAMDKALQARIRLAAKHADEAWSLAGTWRLRATLRAALGDNDVAAESLAQARALAEALSLRSGGAEAPERFLQRTLIDQADHALRSGDLNRAREAADTARMRAEALAEACHSALWLSEASAAWDRLGEAARAAGAHAQAQDAFARAVEFRRLAGESTPADPAHARALASALVKQGELALDTGFPAGARAAFHEGASIRLKFVEETPNNRRALYAFAAALERLGLAALACGDRDAARGAWEEQLHVAERIFPDSDTPESLRFRAIIHAHLAGASGADAESHRLQALALFDDLAKGGIMSEREAALRKKLWGA